MMRAASSPMEPLNKNILLVKQWWNMKKDTRELERNGWKLIFYLFIVVVIIPGWRGDCREVEDWGEDRRGA